LGRIRRLSLHQSVTLRLSAPVESHRLAFPISGPIFDPIFGPGQHAVEQRAALGLPLLPARHCLRRRALPRAVVGAAPRGLVLVVLLPRSHRRFLRLKRLFAGKPEHPHAGRRQIGARRRGRGLARLPAARFVILPRHPRADQGGAGVVPGRGLPGERGERGERGEQGRTRRIRDFRSAKRDFNFEIAS